MLSNFARPLATILLIAVTGCRYEIPLVAGSEIPVDREVLGTWERSDSKRDERVQVIRFTDHEYLLNYYVDDDALYMRAWLIEFDGQEYAQVEFIGTNDEVIKEDDRKFDVIRYKLSGESAQKMSVWRLNTDVISDDIATSRHLKESITQNVENEALFSKYGEFEKQG